LDNSRFYSALAALLFAAVCAWMGAALYSALPPPGTLSAVFAADEELPMLYGIVLRREEALDAGLSQNSQYDALTRFPAGAVLFPEEEARMESVLYCAASDGLEYLSPSDAEALTPGSLDKLLASEPKKAGKARLIYGFDFYYAAFSEAAPDISPGPCRVCFDGTEEIYHGSILSVSTEEGRCALLIRLRISGEDFACLRICRAKLIL